MKHPLEIPDALAETLRHLAPELKKKVKVALEEISSNPSGGKPLAEELRGFRSYKVGQFRIIYREKTKIIEIVTLGPRRTIYQKTALEIKKRLSSNQ